ncbi:MAG: DUF5810 domain-containing protein [Haloplanus sp.]
MGYACPVCDTPHPDADHLANHLAFTAMLHGDAHEEWLDDRIPDWDGKGTEDLAAIVSDHAEDADYDAVFEEAIPEGTADGHPDHAHGTPLDGGSLDDDARRALAEAREMTRAMLDEGDIATGDDYDDATDDATDANGKE